MKKAQTKQKKEGEKRRKKVGKRNQETLPALKIALKCISWITSNVRV